ncbi:hypothetical protein EPN81_02920 [Patescibacteria group bacterium]|nr:MAG: hypothetical protein EPN81_02920 [Patescibacteria group bacterium]
MDGKPLDVIDIKKPTDIDYAKHLAKVVSKLSPLLGNMIEFEVVNELNTVDWDRKGIWVRQDPGFPDAFFVGEITPAPGIEIKTWFPLATEITARFKESIDHFSEDQTDIAIIAWVPEYIIYGKPKVIGCWMDSAKSFALARDKHYHNPPDYLVFEPEDTSTRTSNLQQRNTNGYKFQGTPLQMEAAKKFIKKWGKDGGTYHSTKEYQELLKTLLAKFPYRLDTNFAKIDRIQHAGLEEFKSHVLGLKILNHTVAEWSQLIREDEDKVRYLIEDLI